MDIKAYIESGVVESYVLGLASSQEIAEMDRLRGQYPEIQQAIDSFETSLEKAAFTNTVAPSPGIKEKIMNSIKNDSSQGAAIIPMVSSPARKMGWMQYAVAASVILLVSSAGLNIYFYRQFSAANEKYVALLNDKTSLEANLNIYRTKTLDMYSSMQMMSDPSVIKVSMPGVKGMENNFATVFWDSKTKDVYLLPNKLPQAKDDQQYQLWALVDGKPVDAGMIGDCNGLCRLKNIQVAQGFAITLEKKGGGPIPHGQMYVLGKVATS